MSAPAGPRQLSVDDDGRLTLPADLRQKLGLKQGDAVSVVEVPAGLLLTTEAMLADRDFDLVEPNSGNKGSRWTS